MKIETKKTRKALKNKINTLLLIGLGSLFIGCSTSPEDLVGKSLYGRTSGVMVWLASGNEYVTEQKENKGDWASTCRGEGRWELINGKVVLHRNNSNCETNQGMAGTYDVSDFE